MNNFPKNKSLIPKGQYCNCCPYWRKIEDRPYQYNGWCDYLEMGDIEINAESEYISGDGEIQTAEEIGLPLSLLWDGCKECRINMEDEDE